MSVPTVQPAHTWCRNSPAVPSDFVVIFRPPFIYTLFPAAYSRAVMQDEFLLYGSGGRDKGTVGQTNGWSRLPISQSDCEFGAMT